MPNRLSPRDTTQLVLVTGLWGICFAAHLTRVVGGGLAWIPLAVDGASGPSEPPVIRTLWPGNATRDLQVGDRVLSVGRESALGASGLAFVILAYAESDAGTLEMTIARGGAVEPLRLGLQPIAHVWRKSLVSCGLAVLGALVLWRRGGTRVGRAFHLAMTAYAIHWADFFGGPAFTTVAGVATFGLSTAATGPLALRAVMAFPEESSLDGPWHAVWPWVFALNGVVMTAWAFGLPRPVEDAATWAAVGNAAFISTLLVLLIRSQLRCGPEGHRKLRWVWLGFGVGLGPALITAALTAIEPSLWWVYECTLALALAIPICLWIAITRAHLFDVDRLITQATSYTVLGTLVLGGLFVAIPRVARAASPTLDPSLTQSGLFLVLAAALMWGHRALGPTLERRLFPERKALLSGAQELRDSLGRCDKPSEVFSLLADRLRWLLRLETAVVYARAADAFAPVRAYGPAVSPAFDPEGAFCLQLQETGRAVDVSRSTGLAASRSEREALQTMGTECAVPVMRSGSLVAFCCLAGKRSGDVFTATDLALIESITDHAGAELERFELQEVARQSRAMAVQFRDLVPGEVARELDEGANLESGEREVTVLFVDMRGYTQFAERQTPEAIFDAIGRYTGLVSEIVDACGGWVVEFKGDGMMTVFGAPRSLIDKESSALKAAQRIVREVPGLEIVDHEGQRVEIEVGVGIATGPAYVGLIRSIDRSIWVALGNTTNLAARLEAKTRELDASILIDEATRRAADPADCEDFSAFPAQSIRGRSDRLDLYGRPRPAERSEKKE